MTTPSNIATSLSPTISFLMAEVGRMEAEVALLREALEVLRKHAPSTPEASTPERSAHRRRAELATAERASARRRPAAAAESVHHADPAKTSGLTSAELAGELGSNVASICKWRKAGMPHTRVGLQSLHDLAACRTWIEKHVKRRGSGTSAKGGRARGGRGPEVEPDQNGPVAGDADHAPVGGVVRESDGETSVPAAATTDDSSTFRPLADQPPSAPNTEPPADQAQRRVLRMFARVNRPLLMTEARDELQVAAIPTLEIRALIVRGFLEPGTLQGRPAYRITSAGRQAAEKSRAGAGA